MKSGSETWLRLQISKRNHSTARVTTTRRQQRTKRTPGCYACVVYARRQIEAPGNKASLSNLLIQQECRLDDRHVMRLSRQPDQVIGSDRKFSAVSVTYLQFPIWVCFSATMLHNSFFQFHLHFSTSREHICSFDHELSAVTLTSESDLDRV